MGFHGPDADLASIFGKSGFMGRGLHGTPLTPRMPPAGRGGFPSLLIPRKDFGFVLPKSASAAHAYWVRSAKNCRLSPRLLWRLSKAHACSTTVLVDELNAGGQKLVRRIPKSMISQKEIGFVLQLRTLRTCYLHFDLILSLHEAADRARSARCGAALVTIEAKQVRQGAPDRFGCARRLVGRHRWQRVDGTFWLCLA